jgi:hypothetical protein
VYGRIYFQKMEERVEERKKKGGGWSEAEERALRHDLTPVLLIARVATGRVYPANRKLVAKRVTNTISDAVGRANVPGFDAHFALVKHAKGYDFEPVASVWGGAQVLTELVAFDTAQVLPLAVVEPRDAPAFVAAGGRGFVP